MRNQAKAVILHDRLKIALQSAFEQTVFVLTCDKVIQIVMLRCPLRFDHLPCSKRRAAAVANLACPHQIIQRAQGFFDWCERIRAVNDVEIDPVGFEPLQTGIDGGQNVAARSTFQVARVIHGQPAFACQHDVFATFTQTFAENFLRFTAIAISVGSIDQCNPQIECLVYDFARGFKIATVATKIIAAEPNHRDLETGVAQITLFHSERLFADVL